jgi:phage shock protein C
MQGNDSYGKNGIYRSRDGWIFGVCQGLADHWDFSAGWLRIIVVLLTCVSFGLPAVIAYVIAAFLMKPEPR